MYYSLYIRVKLDVRVRNSVKRAFASVSLLRLSNNLNNVLSSKDRDV